MSEDKLGTITEQLEEFKELKKGWCEGMQLATDWGKIPGGFGEVPSHKDLGLLTELFDKYYDKNLPVPYLYPTPEGGVQAEWSVGRHEISLEIDFEFFVSEWINTDLDDLGYDDIKNISLIDPDDWKWLNKRLGQVIKENK